MVVTENKNNVKHKKVEKESVLTPRILKFVVISFIIPLLVLYTWNKYEIGETRKENAISFESIIENEDPFKNKIDDLNSLLMTVKSTNDKELELEIIDKIGYYYIESASTSDNILESFYNGLEYYQKALDMCGDNKHMETRILLNMGVANIGMSLYDTVHSDLYVSRGIDYLERVLEDSKIDQFMYSFAMMNLSKGYVIRRTDGDLENGLKCTDEIEKITNQFIGNREVSTLDNQERTLIVNNIINRSEILARLYENTRLEKYRELYYNKMSEFEKLDSKSKDELVGYYGNVAIMSSIEYNIRKSEEFLLKEINANEKIMNLAGRNSSVYYTSLEELVNLYPLLPSYDKSKLDQMIVELNEFSSLSNNIDVIDLEMTILGIETSKASSIEELEKLKVRYELLASPLKGESQSNINARVHYMLSKVNLKSFELTNDKKYLDEWTKNISTAMQNKDFYNEYLNKNPEVIEIMENIAVLDIEDEDFEQKKKIINELMIVQE